MAEEWITVREASKILDVTRNHVRKLIGQGRLEAKKFGFMWMVNRASVEAYAQTDRRPGPKPKDS